MMAIKSYTSICIHTLYNIYVHIKYGLNAVNLGFCVSGSAAAVQTGDAGLNPT